MTLKFCTVDFSLASYFLAWFTCLLQDVLSCFHESLDVSISLGVSSQRNRCTGTWWGPAI